MWTLTLPHPTTKAKGRRMATWEEIKININRQRGLTLNRTEVAAQATRMPRVGTLQSQVQETQKKKGGGGRRKKERWKGGGGEGKGREMTFLIDRSPSNRGLSFKRNQKGVEDVTSTLLTTPRSRRRRTIRWQYRAVCQEEKVPPPSPLFPRAKAVPGRGYTCQ